MATKSAALQFFEAICGRAVTEKDFCDLHVYRPEGKLAQHSIDTMRELSDEVFTAPYEHAHKFILLEAAERLPLVSANALLKTFEDPPKTSIIVLLAERAEDILPTIRSRCKQIGFRQQSTQTPCLLDWHMLLQNLPSLAFYEIKERITSICEQLEAIRQEASDAFLAQHQPKDAELTLLAQEQITKMAAAAGAIAAGEEVERMLEAVLSTCKTEGALTLVDNARTAYARSVRPAMIWQTLCLRLRAQLHLNIKNDSH